VAEAISQQHGLPELLGRVLAARDIAVADVPVVLLYPGKRRDLSALSFMGELQPDRDYRPRIYGAFDLGRSE
jgi:hypothetical protein